MKKQETINIINNEDEIIFKYNLEGAGWANAYLKIGDKQITFDRISYLCYPITDLLSGLYSLIDEWDIIDEHGEKVEISNDSSVFEWEDEPGGYEWKLARSGKNEMRIVIKSIYGDAPAFPKYGEIVLDKIVDFNIFTTVVIREIDRIVKDFGILGFRANWLNNNDGNGQFPLSSFLRLKYYLLYDKVLCLQTEGKTENWSLKEELELLNAEV